MAKTVLDWHSLINTILPFVLIGGGKGEAKSDQALKAGLLSFLKKDDEVSFEEALSELDEVALSKSGTSGEGTKIILSWLKGLEESEDKNKQKIPPTFRKIITTHPKKEARVKILKSYARAENDDERTQRYITVTLPEWFTKVVGAKVKRVVEIVSEKAEQSWPAIKEDISSGLDTLEAKMQAKIDEINARTGGQNV